MFFFSSRRRHTRYIGDWSSDVCSSDLLEKRREADSGSSMPGATATPDVEVIVEDARGGGGGGGRPPDGGDGGDDGDYGKGWQREPPSPRRFSTGIAIAMVSILMFFMALASAF